MSLIQVRLRFPPSGTGIYDFGPVARLHGKGYCVSVRCHRSGPAMQPGQEQDGEPITQKSVSVPENVAAAIRERGLFGYPGD